MTDLEKALFSITDQKKFWEVCRSAFAGQSGAALKKHLASISNPLHPPIGRDTHETYRLIGRAEVVSLLLKYSEAETTPADLIALTESNPTQ